MLKEVQKYLTYSLPAIFILSVTALLIFKSPLTSIANRTFEEPQNQLHIFNGYKIVGSSYEVEVAFLLHDSVDTKNDLKNTLASCYGRCLRDKKCVAVSSDIKKENGNCIIYTSIKKILKDPQSKTLFRFSDKKEHQNYSIIPGYDIFSHNIADFSIDSEEPFKTCRQSCLDNKKCRSFAVVENNKKYHCWLKDILENQDFIFTKNKKKSSVYFGIIIGR